MTGVQTCALPISFSVEGVSSEYAEYANALIEQADAALAAETGGTKIGRASCRERV